MRVHILYEIKEGPYGGANQFLKALRQYFIRSGQYAERPEEADLFLYNSCNDVERVMRCRKRFPDKIFVQRLDGPVRLYNKMSDKRDLIANTMNKRVADATVFQSEYSRSANHKMGLRENAYETVILNAPDSSKFYPDKEKKFPHEGKVRLAATSWSDNMNKGFRVFQYLDEHLDFTRYEMCFIGKSPVRFQNIRIIEPQPSERLGELLRSQDIYIMAAIKESCSNALIEAMFCGLPAVALRDGGHPEIVGRGGELFDTPDEIEDALERICADYQRYVAGIGLADIEAVGAKYGEFMESVLEDMRSNGRQPKKLTAAGAAEIYFSLFVRKVSDRLG